jgi:aminoglycoside phosphotransferase (APT) family kinase protein
VEQPEEPVQEPVQELAGGNSNSVRRVGDTVLRRAGAWTPTIHAWLRHLRARGVEWVPEPLGVSGDDEILSFIAGEVPLYPLPPYVWTDEALIQGARMLRQLHDASLDFDRSGAIWQLDGHEPAEVVCHNDFAPHNLAFDDGRIVGAIDFDMAAPGPRLWDLAYFATRIVPLGAQHPWGAPRETESRRRIQLVLDSYGSDAHWTELVAVAIIRLRDLSDHTVQKSRDLERPDLLDHSAGYLRDARYLEGILAALPPAG